MIEEASNEEEARGLEEYIELVDPSRNLWLGPEAWICLQDREIRGNEGRTRGEHE